MRAVIDADKAAERLEEPPDPVAPEAITKGEKQSGRSEPQSLAGDTSSGTGSVSAIDEFWKLAAEGRAAVDPNTTSAHDDFYDEYGLPI